MENIRPWCISRQLWWGHRIPVWYRGDETYVGTSRAGGRRAGSAIPDVLDTWFSSALWPFATLGWPERDRRAARLLPDRRARHRRDIIFLWVARMVMMGLEFTGEIPFARRLRALDHPGARTGAGCRSRSAPASTRCDLIDGGPRPPVFAKSPGEDPGEFPAYGADAVRWGLLAMSSGQDVRFNEEKIAQGQQLDQQALERLAPDPAARRSRGARRRPTPTHRRGPLDPVAAAARASTRSRDAIERFDFSHAALALYDFVYGELCDWYLELVKPRLYEGDAGAPATLLHVLTETRRARAPADPVRHRGDLQPHPGRRGSARRRASPLLPRRDRRRPPRPSWRARSRRSRRCAPGATPPG